MYKYYEVKFKYADAWSHWEWREQKCQLEAKDEYDATAKCMELYGLGSDCDYKVISVKEI